MKILLSAYACIPDRGSEPGVGWHWATKLADQGHDVYVLTRAEYSNLIEDALKKHPRPSLTFVYYELPKWACWWFVAGKRGVRIHYALWQYAVKRTAKYLISENKFDIIHHITYGVFRHPSFLASLGVPFVFGPVGGGESAPWALRMSYPIRGILYDWIRDIVNRFASWDPLLNQTLRHSSVILCKTRDTVKYIPSEYKRKCFVRLEIGTKPIIHKISEQPIVDREEFRILYVGRLIYWKGLHLGIKAFANFLNTFPNSKLTIIGKGRDANWLRKLVDELGIQDSVEWQDWVEHDELLKLYPTYHVFLFPSLHDSSGNVVLEALSAGLPVICLDLGGPGAMVNEQCGRVVATTGKNEKTVIHDLSCALREFASNRVILKECQKGAIERSIECQWENIVCDTYDDIQRFLFR